jgi:serine/threonine-protein kinase RsbW
MSNDVRLNVPCRLDQLRVVAEAVRSCAEPVVGASDAALIDMAVTELCANVCKHGHPDDAEHTYAVAIHATAEAVVIEVRDEGPAFAGASVAEMPRVDVELDDLPEGGFGQALIAQTMDEFIQWREGSVNVSRIVKRVR